MSVDGVRDPRFWYPDGNVVIEVEGTHFKLLRSRLMQQSYFFRDLFSSDTSRQPQPSSVLSYTPSAESVRAACPEEIDKEIDGCVVYEITIISLQDFKTFLEYHEYPM